MSIVKHCVTVELHVDEEALAAHVDADGGSNPPYSKDVAGWNRLDDLLAAVDLEIVDARDCDVDYHGKVEG